MEGYLTAKEFCERENIDRSTLWRRVARGQVLQIKDKISGRAFYKDPSTEFLTTKEVCYRLDITDRTLRNYIRAGYIKRDPEYKKLFSVKEVERFEKTRLANMERINPVMPDVRGR